MGDLIFRIPARLIKVPTYSYIANVGVGTFTSALFYLLCKASKLMFLQHTLSDSDKQVKLFCENKLECRVQC